MSTQHRTGATQTRRSRPLWRTLVLGGLVIVALFLLGRDAQRSDDANDGALDRNVTTTPADDDTMDDDTANASSPDEVEDPDASTAADDEPRDDSTPTQPDSSPPEDEAGSQDGEEPAITVVLAFLRATDQLLQGEGDLDGVSAYASEAALAGVEATHAEFTSVGWVQESTVQVVEIGRVEDVDVAGRPALRVEACIDASDVAIVDADGVEVRPAAEAGSRRSLQWFDVDDDDEPPTVVDTSFPDDADC